MARNGKVSSAKEKESAGSLPLFFEKPAAIDAKRHAKAGIKPTDDFSFAQDTNSIPLNALEFVEAAKYYPIVFTLNEPVAPVALVGLEKSNYFVEKSTWRKKNYVPAYVRKYPFIFTEVPEMKQYVLCVDEKAPHYRPQSGEGVLPFYDNGKPSELTRGALEFCTAFHNHYQMTRQFVEDLKKHELFMPNQSDARLNSGRTIKLSGFQLIDEKKFNELSDDVILEFRKKGWLPFIYFALMSMSNWQRLVDLAAEADAA